MRLEREEVVQIYSWPQCVYAKVENENTRTHTHTLVSLKGLSFFLGTKLLFCHWQHSQSNKESFTCHQCVTSILRGDSLKVKMVKFLGPSTAKLLAYIPAERWGRGRGGMEGEEGDDRPSFYPSLPIIPGRRRRSGDTAAGGPLINI